MKKVILLIISAAWLFGCGYTTRGFMFEEERIVVAPVKNELQIATGQRSYSEYTTYPILIEKELTNEMVRQFNQDGHLTVVSRKENALLLNTRLLDYRKSALRYTESDEVREQRLRLVAQITLLNSAGEELQQQRIVGETTFFLSGPNSKSESAARDELVTDTARRIVEAVVESW
ncbi:MAG: hypothetical protein GF333_00065 [Candidatus Omnitrophica bacterium]|nr:hypothetical protein [Candidatus Omnitrophota bacterium]